MGALWSYFYWGRTLFMFYVTYRVSKLLVKRFISQSNGDTDFMSTVAQDEWQYQDWYKDRKDGRMVNFRYTDHKDRCDQFGLFNPDVFKPDADYAKGLLKHFKKGNDSYFDYFFKRS